MPIGNIIAVSGIFNEKMGIDLNGKALQSPTVFDSSWKHVSVGLSSFSPLTFGEFALTYKFKKEGKGRILIDNIRIKNMKGKVIYNVFTDELDKGSIKPPKASVIELN